MSSQDDWCSQRVPDLLHTARRRHTVSARLGLVCVRSPSLVKQTTNRERKGERDGFSVLFAAAAGEAVVLASSVSVSQEEVGSLVSSFLPFLRACLPTPHNPAAPLHRPRERGFFLYLVIHFENLKL